METCKAISNAVNGDTREPASMTPEEEKRASRRDLNRRGFREKEIMNGGSSSESEYHHALEVIFDGEGQHRRKSSLIDEPELAARLAAKQRTQCQVHQLLESQQRKISLSRRSRNPDLTLPEKGLSSSKHSPVLAAVNAIEKPLHSRLMTKRELSAMAVGVRDLSKKLGSIRLRIDVKTVFLLTKVHDPGLILKTRELADWLLDEQRDKLYTVYVENTFKENPLFDSASLIAKKTSREGRLKYWDNEMCRTHPHTFDFAVTLGGDGTVLYASWLFQRIVPPVLSFALGSLGFLTKFDFKNVESILTAAFRAGVTVSLRLRFECTVMRSQRKERSGNCDLVEELIAEETEGEHTHKPDGSYDILNDIVVDRGPNATMSAIEILGDDQHFTTVQADGVCVATPTGSTAYNLSAGGSLCHPDNPVILVTAICAHTLSFRPIILPDTIVLRIGVPYDARTSSWASFDGRERVELEPGDYVTISASRYPFASVMPEGKRSEDWVNSISRTLQWNSRQRQKSFKEWEAEGSVGLSKPGVEK